MAWTTIATPADAVNCVAASPTHIWGVQQDGSLFSFDPLTDTYDIDHAGFPASSSYLGMVFDPDTGPAGSLWLFGNGDTYVYDIDSDTWDVKTSDPFVSGGRFMFACARDGRRVICAGGDDFVDTTDGVTAYDLDTDTWSELAPMPGVLGECQGALIGSTFYVFGGATSAFSTYVVTVYAYDTIGDSWSTITGVPYDTDFAGFPTAAALSTGTVFTEGGNGGTPSDKTWLYDSGLDDWTAGDDTPFAGLKVSVTFEDVVYLFSGEFGSPAAARFGELPPPPVGLAEITAELVTLPDLEPVPDVDLSDTFDRSWIEQLNDAGSGSISFANDDPALDAISLPNTLVNLFVRGVLAVTLMLQRFTAVDVSPQEEIDERTVYEGLLHVGLLDRSPIYPSNGPGRKPVQRDRSFNWTSLDYDDSSWVSPTIVTTLDVAQSGGWAAGITDWQFDPAFPDASSVAVLWASDGTTTLASDGDCYFRRAFNIDDPGFYAIFCAIDNYGEVYIDGQLVMSPGQSDDLRTGFVFMSHYVADLSVGPHVLAIKATNAGGGPVDPGGVAYAIYHSNPNGSQLGTRIVVSEAVDAKIVEYAVPDGMPIGQVVNLLLAEAQARGEIPYVTVSFTDTEDTDGATWPLLLDASTKVGTSLLGALREWSDTYIDFYMAPGTTVLDVWIKGTRGTDVSGTVSYHRPTDPGDESTGNLLSLTRTGEAAVANDLLVDSAAGWSHQTDTLAVVNDGVIGQLLSLGALSSPDEVARVSDGQLAIFKGTRTQTDIVIDPRTDAETPYVGYAGTGDTVDVEGDNHRVLSMAVSENNDTGKAHFVPSLNEAIVLSSEERFAQALRKYGGVGTLGGRSRAAQPALPRFLPQVSATVAQTAPVFFETFNKADSFTIGPDTSWDSWGTYGDDTGDHGAPGTVAQVSGNTFSVAPPGGASNPISCFGAARIDFDLPSDDMEALYTITARATIMATESLHQFDVYVRQPSGTFDFPGGDVQKGWGAVFQAGDGYQAIQLTMDGMLFGLLSPVTWDTGDIVKISALGQGADTRVAVYVNDVVQLALSATEDAGFGTLPSVLSDFTLTYADLPTGRRVGLEIIASSQDVGTLSTTPADKADDFLARAFL